VAPDSGAGDECVGITSHASTLTWGSLDGDLLYIPAALGGAAAMQAIISVACVASPWRMTPWERLTGIEVRHAVPLGFQGRPRGFGIVPVPADARVT
jgi:hypothetical protein